MAGRKRIIIDGQCLVDALTHYTDGDVPLGARLLGIGVNRLLQRSLAVYVEAPADQWRDRPDPTTGEFLPLHVRFEGSRVFSWGDKREPYSLDTWREHDPDDTPKRKG